MSGRARRLARRPPRDGGPSTLEHVDSRGGRRTRARRRVARGGSGHDERRAGPRGRHLVSRHGCRRPGRGPRRGGLQHEHDRVPGGADRSLLRRADRDDDVAADRELRRVGGRHRIERAARRRVHHARVVAGREQLARRDDAARLPDPPRHRRHRRHRHAGPHAQAAVGRRHARRDRDRRRRTRRSSCSARARSRRWRAPTSCRPSPARRRTSGWRRRSRRPGEFGVPPERRASRRLRIAAYDFGIKQNILRRLAQHNCDVTVFPAVGACRRPARASSPTACS